MKRGYAERAFRLCFRKRINARRALHGITACRVSPSPFGLDSILALGEIPYRNELRIPYARGASDSLHGFAVISARLLALLFLLSEATPICLGTSTRLKTKAVKSGTKTVLFCTD